MTKVVSFAPVARVYPIPGKKKEGDVRRGILKPMLTQRQAFAIKVHRLYNIYTKEEFDNFIRGYVLSPQQLYNWRIAYPFLG